MVEPAVHVEDVHPPLVLVAGGGQGRDVEQAPLVLVQDAGEGTEHGAGAGGGPEGGPDAPLAPIDMDLPLLSPRRLWLSLKFFFFCQLGDLHYRGGHRLDTPFWATLWFHRRPRACARAGHPDWG